MNNKSIPIILSMGFLFLFMSATTTSAANLMGPLSFRVTITEQDVTYEYEFDNPDYYEYEEGDHVKRGAEAKQKVTRLVSLINLEEDAAIDAMVRELKKMHPNVSKVDIRYMNEENKLYTWVWNNE
ncbi:hypothetical protein RYX45_12120 [Alkalihalophilus pseudofirmus]|uniref:Uncharacterized protein n=1 Tax=Alkalihalophilus pseudofirmus TaxID=79885 RepID=A0AAJ2NP66_ALKPS|nr:hypothetical protein [Alkalihalophilus pseudofirmus]MDV2885926.1 hypothetical protein [Alkalihalophilus pseudofirmus]